MESIPEIEHNKINYFLQYCGLAPEQSIDNDDFSKIIGKENNIFTENDIEYNSIYEYLNGYKYVDNLISLVIDDDKRTRKRSATKTKQDNSFSINYTKLIIFWISVALWLINFFMIPGPYVYKCAKGFGLNLRIWTIILSFLMCRTLLMGRLSKHTDYHVFIGYIYTICTLGHTICHFIFHIGTDAQYITGYLLTFFTLLMTITSYFRHYKYDLFFYIHRLNYLFLPILIIHFPKLWYWFVAALVVVAIEGIINYYFKTQISTLANSRVSKYQNIIYLSFHRAIASTSGSYYRIMIPSINTEWHSFSVASTHLTDQMLFIVEVRGDWTQKLFEKLSSKSNDIAVIMGPYMTSSCDILIDETENNLCIAGGIGIAPFISVVDTKVQLGRINDDYRANYLDTVEEIMEQKRSLTIQNLGTNFSRHRREKLTLVWIVRSPQHLMKYIDDILGNSEDVNIRIYITGKFTKEENIKHRWFMITKLQRSNIVCYFRRPIIDELISQNYNNVFFCGPDRLEKDVKRVCNEKMVKFHTEKFD